MPRQALNGETILAPSTPPGQSGLAVLRLAGPAAISLADRFFRPKRGHARLTELPGYRLVPGDFAVLDEVVIGLYRAPHSFTGDDVVEIYCHGGSAIKRAIMQTLLAAGAVLAEPGEFSRRAFVNGKIDLVQAEAIMDLIGAEASRQTDAAYAQLKGRLSEACRDAATTLYEAMAAVELMLEFPEHEMSEAATGRLGDTLAALSVRLGELAASYERGRLIRDGARVVIYGEPNVGKSSLLNAFIGQNRAIVTDIPGTTRDTIEHHLELGGYKVILIDTAGIRQTDDVIEQEGVRRSEAAVASADIVLALCTDRPAAADWQALAALKAAGKGLVILRGKDDLSDADTVSQEVLTADLNVYLPDVPLLAYSARRKDDQAALAAAIEAQLNATDPGGGELWVTNIRHKVALSEASEEIRLAAADVRAGQTFDLVAVRLRTAADRLAELTGDDVSESLIETIFASFCVGK